MGITLFSGWDSPVNGSWIWVSLPILEAAWKVWIEGLKHTQPRYCVCILIYWEHCPSKFLTFHWSSMRSETPKRHHSRGNTLDPNFWKAEGGITSIPLPLTGHLEHLPPSVKESSVWVPTICTVTLLWASCVCWEPLIKLSSLLGGSLFPQVWLSRCGPAGGPRAGVEQRKGEVLARDLGSRLVNNPGALEAEMSCSPALIYHEKASTCPQVLLHCTPVQWAKASWGRLRNKEGEGRDIWRYDLWQDSQLQ